MARPKKLYEGEQKVMSEEYPSVKTLVQTIATAPGADARYGRQVDEIVGSWVDRGYTLVSAYPYANSNDTVVVVYVLVKYPVV